MGLMGDDELERLRRRRLAQLQNRLLDGREEQVDRGRKGKEGKEDLLRRVFVGRAWEVFQATQKQYPQVAKRLGEVLAQLVSSGKINQELLSSSNLHILSLSSFTSDTKG